MIEFFKFLKLSPKYSILKILIPKHKKRQISAEPSVSRVHAGVESRIESLPFRLRSSKPFSTSHSVNEVNTRGKYGAASTCSLLRMKKVQFSYAMWKKEIAFRLLPKIACKRRQKIIHQSGYL